MFILLELWGLFVVQIVTFGVLAIAAKFFIYIYRYPEASCIRINMSTGDPGGHTGQIRNCLISMGCLRTRANQEIRVLRREAQFFTTIIVQNATGVVKGFFAAMAGERQIGCLTRWGGAVRLLGRSFGGVFDGRLGRNFSDKFVVGGVVAKGARRPSFVRASRRRPLQRHRARKRRD